MLIEKKGNLFKQNHPVFAHGVSNVGKMNKGIAIEFRDNYPEMFQQYRNMCSQGTLKPGDVFYYHSINELPSVMNLITQDNLFFANKTYLENSINNMHAIAIKEQITNIAMPLISVGLGQLEKNDLLESLRYIAADRETHVTIYTR